MGDLSKNFSKSEITCKCGCGLSSISLGLIEKLQNMRIQCGFPFTITSGCRCAKHNKAVGGKLDSAHLPDPAGICHAVDIAFATSNQLYAIIGAAIAFGVKRIGINFAKRFVHIDDDKGKPQPVIFSY